MDELQASNVSAKSNLRIAGSGSYKVLEAGAHTDLNGEAIQPLGATTFTVYKEDEEDLLSERMGSVELPAGMYGPAPNGRIITSLTFTGGPVQLYLKSS